MGIESILKMHDDELAAPTPAVDAYIADLVGGRALEGIVFTDAEILDARALFLGEMTTAAYSAKVLADARAGI